MALQLIDLGNEVEVVEIDTSKVPYTFSVKLTDKTYTFTVKYNEAGSFFTVDLATSDGEPLVYGDIVRYGRPLFGICISPFRAVIWHKIVWPSRCWRSAAMAFGRCMPRRRCSAITAEARCSLTKKSLNC